MILSLLYRAISWVAGIVIAFSNVGVLAEAPNTPAWDTKAFQSSIDKSNLAFSPKWDITFDDTLMEAFAVFKQETGMDVPAAASSVKDLYWTHRWMVKMFPGIFYGLRDRWLAKGDYWQAHDGNKMVIYRLLGICVGMPTKVFIAAEPSLFMPDTPAPAEEAPIGEPESIEEPEPGGESEPAVEPAAPATPGPGEPYEYDIYIYCTYADGSVRGFDSFSKYNKITGEFGEKNGVGGLSYNFNFNENFAYTTKNSWQRALGYMKLYDTLLLQRTDMVNIETVRVKFPYQGRDWMLQLWKGRYFTTTGGEIGIYNKPKNRLVEFYDAAKDSERIYMSFKVTAFAGTYGETMLVDRDVTYHWWMTGFAVRQRLYAAGHLTLESVIVPTDTEMYNAMKTALAREKVPFTEITWPGSDENGNVPMPAFEIAWE